MALKILIVDDSEVDLRKLQLIIENAGHLALPVNSAALALSSAKSDKPDLILMDVTMPIMDGFAATRKLKADDATKGIPVVFVTSRNQKADIAWGHMLGAKGFVVKPYSKEQILEQLLH